MHVSALGHRRSQATEFLSKYLQRATPSTCVVYLAVQEWVGECSVQGSAVREQV